MKLYLLVIMALSMSMTGAFALCILDVRMQSEWREGAVQFTLDSITLGHPTGEPINITLTMSDEHTAITRQWIEQGYGVLPPFDPQIHSIKISTHNASYGLRDPFLRIQDETVQWQPIAQSQFFIPGPIQSLTIQHEQSTTQLSGPIRCPACINQGAIGIRGAETCCSGLEKYPIDSQLFTCDVCGNGICGPFQQYSTCFQDCPPACTGVQLCPTCPVICGRASAVLSVFEQGLISALDSLYLFDELLEVYGSLE